MQVNVPYITQLDVKRCHDPWHCSVVLANNRLSGITWNGCS